MQTVSRRLSVWRDSLPSSTGRRGEPRRPVLDGSPAACVSYMSQNFCLIGVSNLSVLNFRIFLLMYPGSVRDTPAAATNKVPGTGD